MIEQVKIINSAGEALMLHPSSDYSIGEMNGLGPVKATVASSDIGGTDGCIFNSARLGQRNIVIPIYPLGPNVGEKRIKLYRYLSPKAKVTFCTTFDSRSVQAEAYVEALDGGPEGSQQCLQASLLCMDPFFHGVDAENQAMVLEDDRFTFPFSIASDGMVFSEVDSAAVIVLRNHGDVAAGVEISLALSGAVANPKVINWRTGDSIGVNASFVAGDVLKFDTRHGKKQIHRIRDAVSTNLLNFLTAGSTWVQLPAGESVMELTADSGLTNIQATFRVTELFVGV